MSQLSEFMTRDHRLCDQKLVPAEDAAQREAWADAGVALQDFRAATERHFAREEDVLFPAFEEATGMRDGPTAIMRAEHGQVRALLDELGEALAMCDARRFLGASETIMVLVQQHNMKEEQVLYPMADQSIGNPAEILDRMRGMEPDA